MYESIFNYKEESVYEYQYRYVTPVLNVMGFITGIMMLISFFLSFVRSYKITWHFFLLGANILISSLIVGIHLWWYHLGKMSKEKYWILLILFSITLFQCIMTDIYVFHNSTIPGIPNNSSKPPTFSNTNLSTSPSL